MIRKDEVLDLVAGFYQLTPMTQDWPLKGPKAYLKAVTLDVLPIPDEWNHPETVNYHLSKYIDRNLYRVLRCHPKYFLCIARRPLKNVFGAPPVTSVVTQPAPIVKSEPIVKSIHANNNKRGRTARLYSAIDEYIPNSASVDKIFLTSHGPQLEELRDLWDFENCYIVESNKETYLAIRTRLRSFGLGERNIDKIVWHGQLHKYLDEYKVSGKRNLGVLDFDGQALPNTKDTYALTNAKLLGCFDYTKPFVIRYVATIRAYMTKMQSGVFSDMMESQLKHHIEPFYNIAQYGEKETYLSETKKSDMEQILFVAKPAILPQRVAV